MNKLLNWLKNKDVQGDIYNLKLTFQAFSPFFRVNDHCCSLRNLRGREEGGGRTRVLLVIQLLVYMKYSNYLFSLNSSLAGGDPHQKTLLHKKKKKKVLSSKLKFQNLIFQDNDTYFKLTYFLNLIIKLEKILQSSSWYTAVIRRPQKPLSSNKHWGQSWPTPWKNKSSIHFLGFRILCAIIKKLSIFSFCWCCCGLLSVKTSLTCYRGVTWQSLYDTRLSLTWATF